jgi:hypothetical protein
MKAAVTELSHFSCIPINLYSYTTFWNNGGSNQRFFRNHVFISRRWNAGCYADIGMMGYRQRLNLDPSIGCNLNKGTIMHEMMHSLGYDHEQNRPDRNNFVRVHYDNIPYGMQLPTTI